MFVLLVNNFTRVIVWHSNKDNKILHLEEIMQIIIFSRENYLFAKCSVTITITVFLIITMYSKP